MARKQQPGDLQPLRHGLDFSDGGHVLKKAIALLHGPQSQHRLAEAICQGVLQLRIDGGASSRRRHARSTTFTAAMPSTRPSSSTTARGAGASMVNTITAVPPGDVRPTCLPALLTCSPPRLGPPRPILPGRSTVAPDSMRPTGP